MKKSLKNPKIPNRPQNKLSHLTGARSFSSKHENGLIGSGSILLFVLFICAFILVDIAATVQPNIAMDYNTTIKGNLALFGDLYVTDNENELLNITIYNINASSLEAVNLTIPFGINVTNIYPPTEWQADNTTDAGGLIAKIMFVNTTNNSAIANGTQKIFSVKFMLNTTKPDEGPLNFTIDAIDNKAQNNLSENITLVVDTILPSVLCNPYSVFGFANNTDIISIDGNITILCSSEEGISANATILHYLGASQDLNWTQIMENSGTPKENYSTVFYIANNGTYDGTNQSLIVLFEDAAGNKKSTTLAVKNISIDTQPPESNQVYINNISFEYNYAGEFEWNKTVNILLDSWDNTTNVTSVYANMSVILENGTNISIGPEVFTNIENNTWDLNFTNTLFVGRYTANITITDTVGLTKDESIWFDIYEKTSFEGNMNYNASASLNTTITFNKANTTSTVHEDTTAGDGAYNLTIGKRKYDIVYKTTYPITNYTNGEAHSILITSLDTNTTNSTKDIIRIFDFKLNESQISGMNNSISIIGLWLNGSVKEYTNNISVKLNLSKYANPYNINGTLLHLCDSWDGDICNSSYNVEAGKTDIDYIKKTITYTTTIQEMYHLSDSQVADKNRTLWFIAFEPENIMFEATDPIITNDNTNLTLKFYKSGTNLLIEQAEINPNNQTNISIYNEEYDIHAEIYQTYDNSKNLIELYNVSMPVIANGSGNVTNILNFRYLDYCIDSSCTQTTMLDNLKLPLDTIGRGYAGISVNADNLVFSSANVTLNYTKAYYVEDSLSRPISLNNIRVYKCAKEDPLLCEIGDWTKITNFEKPTDKKIVKIPTTSFSTYVLTQYQAYNPPQDIKKSSSGGSGGTFGTCGDNVCSIGEDFINCPQDCGLNITCGNNICEFFETMDNCPVDCAIHGASPIVIETTMSNVNLDLDSQKLYDLWITNNQNKTIVADIYVVGEIGKFVQLDIKNRNIENYSSELIQFYVTVPAYSVTGYYNGDIVLDLGAEKHNLPISMTISNLGDTKIDITVKAKSKKFSLGSIAKFNIEVNNYGAIKNIPLILEQTIKNVLTDNVLYVKKTNILVENRTTTYVFEYSIAKENVSLGNYYLITKLGGGDIAEVVATTPFEIVNPFWTSKRIFFTTYLVILLVLSGSLFYGYRRYKQNRLEKIRYLLPLDYSKLPRKTINSFWLGYVADTKNRAWFDSDDLTTHLLVSGSTGSGKSVSASVIVEEALKMKIPVVVFDPTAQWTGFVKACKDENLLDNYSKFNMKREEAKPYKGMIFEVDRTDVNINLKKYMNPGEVTIFNLSRLKPGEYDIAVMNIIQTIFDEPWEESPQLKLLVVFDEVHRLLEKYGGKGGYIALEKACREFRKWGIGLIMASQVSADFKEAVQGNILTEIQLNTKSMEDINKIKSKYGPEFAKRITKQSIGVGIIQNPQYNDGKPWFVNFRPTLHDPHKITEEELKQYDAFAKNLEEIEQQIIMLEKENIDTTDIRLEFKLAQDKLKSGRFRMAEIYLNVLKENLKKIR